MYSTLTQTLLSMITNPFMEPSFFNKRLGEWTDEVPNARIVKFVGMEPKNYGYEFVDKGGNRRSTCKVKGISLDYNTSQIIYFVRMLNWVKGVTKDFRETVNHHLIKNIKTRLWQLNCNPRRISLHVLNVSLLRMDILFLMDIWHG